MIIFARKRKNAEFYEIMNSYGTLIYILETLRTKGYNTIKHNTILALCTEKIGICWKQTRGNQIFKTNITEPYHIVHHITESLLCPMWILSYVMPCHAMPCHTALIFIFYRRWCDAVARLLPSNRNEKEASNKVPVRLDPDLQLVSWKKMAHVH